MANRVLFRRRDVDLPSDLYVGAEEYLVLTSFNAWPQTLYEIVTRVLGPDGVLRIGHFYHTPNYDRTIKRENFTIGEGFLLGVTIAPTTVPARGLSWATLALTRGSLSDGVPAAVLLKGYLEADAPLAWPNGPMDAFRGGPGALRDMQGTVPAAGVEVNELVPTGAARRIQSLCVQLATSPVAGNRTVVFLIDDNTGTAVGAFPSQYPHPPATLANYTLVPGGISAGLFGQSVTIAAPAQIALRAGFRIRTVTFGMDPGDQYLIPFLLVEEWIER